MTRFYTQDHEWIGEDGTVGITDYAQSQLGDITFVELPEVGRAVSKGDAPCVVDSVKASSDVFAPAGGTVSAVNDALADAPELVNSDPEGAGWLFRLDAGPGGFEGLMDRAAYDAYVAGL